MYSREIFLDERHLAKHLPNTQQVQRLLRQGRSTHVFNDEATMVRVTETTLSPVLAQAKTDWDFLEVWVDPLLSPPYILLLLSDSIDNCCVYDPAENYKVLFTASSYNEAETWLLEDEYEPIQGRLSTSNL
jgi:hypothetical protein